MANRAHALEGDGNGRRLDLTLLALLGLATVLRLIGWRSVGLDHFDEGAYAYSAAALASGGLEAVWYPRVELLAPPFQYGAGALAMLLFGISDRVLIGVSVALGIGTVWLVFLVGREWFGRPAATSAALLLAMSDFHILYARSALADVSFGFWLLAGLYCFGRAELRGSLGWAALAGLATGVAWNTKYHGWLLLVIATGAVVIGASTLDRARLRAAGTRIGVAAAVAAALYAPWALYVSRQPGGYALLLEHHATFLRPAAALSQAWTHLQAQLLLDGWLGRSAPGLAALSMVFPAPPGDRARRFVRASLVGLVGLATGLSVFVGLSAIVAALVLRRSESPGARLALSFFLVFSALTPLYLPYPRLALPWLLASVLLAGVALPWLVRGPDAPGERTRGGLGWTPWGSRARPLVAAAVVAVAIACVFLRPPWRSASPYAPKDGFRTASAVLARDVEPSLPVLVWSEPGVAFYLRSLGVPAYPIVDIREAEGWQGAGPLQLVSSLYATRIPGALGLQGWGDAHPGGLQEVARVPVRAVSAVRVLDDFGLTSPSRLGVLPEDFAGYDLRLHRMQRAPDR